MGLPKLLDFLQIQPYIKFKNYNTYIRIKMSRSSIFYLTLLVLITFTFSGAPFIEFNSLHQTYSEFEFNLIINENRNTPIILFQYSQNKTQKKVRGIIQNAFEREPDIAFALFVDCRQFTYDMNKSLALCKGFEQYVNSDNFIDEDFEDDQTLNDPYFGLDLFSPNPTIIKEKGHVMKKSHDHQNLRSHDVSFSGQYLAKVIKNQIPDFVTYIEDQRDLEDFLQLHSEFRTSKTPKLLYFDQNLQSPIFLKKLAVNLDGWFKIGVSDSPKMVAKYKTSFDKLLLFQYDFESQSYQTIQIPFRQDHELRSILKNKIIKSYTNIRKSRDILFDFEHRQGQIYNVNSIKQVNQLISHGRIILLQVSKDDEKFECPSLDKPNKQYGVLFNYACLSRERAAQILTIAQINPSQTWEGKIFFIDGSLKKINIIGAEENMYKYLPQSQARQRITSEKESQLCIEGARAAQKQVIFFYFSEKTHPNSLSLLRYLASLEEVNSLIYFCQFLIPDEDVVRQFQITENSIFSLSQPDENGQSRKIEHTKVDDFVSIKMFLREMGISRIIRFYEQKVMNNEIEEIVSAQDLTQKCFSQKCVIALIQTDTFHQSTQISILKELQIAFNEEPFKYYWIDGTCHFEVGRQLKLTPKGAKFIDKSFLFLYNEKSYQYALWKGNKHSKFWIKKDIFRWVKSLRNPLNISKVKFGIDFEDRKCTRKQDPNTTTKAANSKSSSSKSNQKRKEVSPDEL